MTAEEWDLTEDSVKAFIFRRYEIESLLFPLCNPSYPTIDFSGWTNLTESQKEILTRYYLAPVSLRRTIYTPEQDVKNALYVIERIKKDRIDIILGMIARVRLMMIEGQISVAYSQALMMDTLKFCNTYAEAGVYDLKAWITNEVGTIYENNGMAQNAYFSTTLRDNLMSIYNGTS